MSGRAEASPAPTVSPEDLPEYERAKGSMLHCRSTLAPKFVKQLVLTAGPFLPKTLESCDVADVGCGWGHTAVELAPRCRSLVALEPNPILAAHARELAHARAPERVRVVQAGIEELPLQGRFDLVMLDNVLEHIPDQVRAMACISEALNAGGVAYLIVPNKLWPIEAHYHLPFLAYLPLPLANVYLRLSGRGRDYRDASYAPTLFRLRRLVSAHPELTLHLVPPADPSLAQGGASRLYSWGTAALRRFPSLWMISKVFLALLVKRADGGP